MKVVLLKNVPNLGKAGEIKDVKSGYALNFLIPAKMADVPAGKEANEVINEKKAALASEREKEKEVEAIAVKLNNRILEFITKSDSNGRLYGSIGPKEISEKTGIKPELIKEHFKTTGHYKLQVDLGRGNIVNLIIEIKSEK